MRLPRAKGKHSSKYSFNRDRQTHALTDYSPFCQVSKQLRETNVASFYTRLGIVKLRIRPNASSRLVYEVTRLRDVP